MQLQFDGKKILHTAPMANLLREGECLADTIDIAGPRMYGGLDLASLSWSIVGNYKNYEDHGEQDLHVEANGEIIGFIWVPDGTFSAHSGGMDLLLIGVNADASIVIVIKGDSPITIQPAKRRYSKAVASLIERIYTTCKQAAQQAVQAASDALLSASSSAQSASNAASSASSSSSKAAEAATSATNAANSASTASTKASEAATSANNAAGSASTASNKASEAASSASGASGSASAAASSATNAASSASTASTKAAEAASSASSAAVSASAAAGSAAAAKASEDNAAASRDAAAQSARQAALDADAAQLYAEMAQQVSQGAVGYYATPEALRSAHATASDGNWAIVGSTDTVWVWDSDSGDWRDTSQHIDMSQYYTKSEVQNMVQGAHSNSYTITVPASGWADGALTFQGISCTKYNTVAAAGVSADTRLSLGRYVSGDLEACRSYLCQDTGAGTVTFWATDALAEFTVELVEVK